MHFRRALPFDRVKEIALKIIKAHYPSDIIEISGIPAKNNLRLVSVSPTSV